MELPADRRARFLREACDENPELLANVRQLLADGEIDDGFLTWSAADPAVLWETMRALGHAYR